MYQETIKKLKKIYDEFDNITSLPIVQKVGQAWTPSQDISLTPKQESPSQPTPSQVEP